MHSAVRLLAAEPLGKLDAPPRRWWNRKMPRKRKLCFRRKTDALNIFRDHNQLLIDTYGGEDARHRPAEFDAMNDELELRGRRRIRTIADALWYSLKPSDGPPWCIDDIDLDLLNRTTPGQHGAGFTFPDYVQDAVEARRAERYYESEYVEAGPATDCFTQWRSTRRGRFRHRGNARGAQRERLCVCRDDYGRFARCAPVEEVPF